MKSYIWLILLLTGIFFNSNICFGQDDDSEDVLVSELGTTDLAEQLPPLQELIDIAKNNSPFVKGIDASIEKEKEEVLLVKRNWQDRISLFGNYSVGNQSFLLVGGRSNTQEGGGNFLNGYRAGINAYIPLSILTTRGTKIKVAKLEAAAAESEKAEVELALSNRVTQEYYELLTAYRVLQIKSDAKENVSMQKEMAKEGFADGTVTLEEYSNVDQSASGAAAEFEEARNLLLAKYNQFEQLLGVSLENLRGRQ